MPNKQEEDSNQFMAHENDSQQHHNTENNEDAPFTWGQDENESTGNQKQKIHIEDFFIKPDFDESVRLNTNNNKMIQQNNLLGNQKK